MKTQRKTAIIVGILFLIQGIISVLINQVLSGPVAFGSYFITNAFSYETELVTALLISLINGSITIGIAAMLLPVFKPYNERISYLYFGLSISQFAFIALNEMDRLSLLSLSQEYIQVGSPDAGYIQFMGRVLQSDYWWSHHTIMLVSCITLSFFYYLLYRSKLVPRFIAIWGYAGVALMLTTLLLGVFGGDIIMWLFIPIGLNQLFLAAWLIVTGFNPEAIKQKSPGTTD
ncbi:MAG: DUF4386 domain-containing protein [Balneolaceae bacterium]|nr:DUF4386 domain-containing protein [Balneolaceae bacterium]